MIKHYNKLWSPLFFKLSIASYILSQYYTPTICNHSKINTFNWFLDIITSLNSMTVMWFLMGLVHLSAYWTKECNCKKQGE